MFHTNVLVAYDGSSVSEEALNIAREMSQDNQKMRITLMYVAKLNSSSIGPDDINQPTIESAENVRNHLAEMAKTFSCKTSVEIVEGFSPADLILRHAKEENCDLIVMGARGLGGVRGYLGSTSYHVIHRFHGCVLVVRETPEEASAAEAAWDAEVKTEALA